MREFSPDVIHAQSIAVAAAAGLAAPRVPLLVTVHGIDASDELLASVVLRLSRARVTAVSEAVADGLRRMAFATPVDLLQPGVDLEALARTSVQPVDLPEGAPRICCVARASREKGVDVLIEAFGRLRADLPEARLVLVGDGDEAPAHHALAERLGVAGQIAFVGDVPEAAPYLAGSDVVVLPSRREGLPMVALEALALGRPVVATAVGGTPTVVRDGETGWLVPPEQPGALAAALVEVAANPEEAARRAAAGRALVEGSHALLPGVDRLEEILDEVAHPGQRLELQSRAYYRAARAYHRARVFRASLGAEHPWRGVRIFGYHRITEEDDELAVKPAEFRSQMELLVASGVQPILLADAIGLLERGEATGDRYACVTFDDGYHDNLVAALPELERLQVPGTIFVPSSIMSGEATFSWYRDPPRALTWDEVRTIVRGGLVDVQAHTRTHPRLTQVSDRRSRDEVVGCKAEIEREVGYELTSFCYPAGLYGERELELVRTTYRAGIGTHAGVNTGDDAHRVPRPHDALLGRHDVGLRRQAERPPRPAQHARPRAPGHARPRPLGAQRPSARAAAACAGRPRSRAPPRGAAPAGSAPARRPAAPARPGWRRRSRCTRSSRRPPRR